MSGSVTVPGPGGSTIASVYSNTYNAALAASIAGALNAASKAGSLAVDGYTGGALPTVPAGTTIQELVLSSTVGGSITVPASTVPGVGEVLVLQNSNPVTIHGSPNLTIIGGGNNVTIIDPAVITLADSTTGGKSANDFVSVTAADSPYIVTMPNGTETVFGSGSGSITGGLGTNLLNVTAAGAGTTNIIVSEGVSDSVFAGAGSTSVLSVGTNEQIFGGSGNLFVAGSVNSETVFGSTGNSTVFAAQNGDYFLGQTSGTGSLFIDGGGTAQGGSSTITAGAGALTVFGGTGDHPNQEVLFGGSGALTFIANSGATSIVAGTSQETLFGGSGSYINLSDGTSGVGALYVAGGGNETLNAAGTSVGNMIFAGTDTAGIGSNDSLVGGTGNDTFVGGTGQSTMTGGGGTDYFVFNKATDGGNTTITDFNSNEKLGVFGYGSTSAAIVGASSVVGGSTVISLSDNTKITLAGFTHLSVNNVVT